VTVNERELPGHLVGPDTFLTAAERSGRAWLAPWGLGVEQAARKAGLSQLVPPVEGLAAPQAGLFRDRPVPMSFSHGVQRLRILDRRTSRICILTASLPNVAWTGEPR
jgi:hypothetical protein